jgi:hypothetical protein
MFKVAIKAINPSAKPRPYCGTSSLIPEYLAIGGDRSIQVTISIDSNQPYKAGKTTYEGDVDTLRAEAAEILLSMTHLAPAGFHQRE